MAGWLHLEVCDGVSVDYAVDHLQQLLDKAQGVAGRLLRFSVFYRNQQPEYFHYVRLVLVHHLTFFLPSGHTTSVRPRSRFWIGDAEEGWQPVTYSWERKGGAGGWGHKRLAMKQCEENKKNHSIIVNITVSANVHHGKHLQRQTTRFPTFPCNWSGPTS